MYSMLNIFRLIALLEGLSYILLLGIATPLKYFSNDPYYVKLLGMPHGLLFIAYVSLAIMIKNDFKWKTKEFGIILIASILPFGTFYIDRKYLKSIKL